MMKHVSTTAPGKIILCGEHAVVYRKEAIACSLDLRTHCSIDVFDGGEELKLLFPELKIELSWKICRIHSLVKRYPDVEKPCIVEIGESELGEFTDDCSDGLSRIAVELLLSLYLSIGANFIRERNVGLNIKITSDLPLGSGLGSSASLSVAFVTSLLVICGYIGSKQEQWVETSYRLINDWAYEGEKVVHGHPSGIDNSVAAYGHFLSFKAGRIECLSELNHLMLDLLVVNTKVPRSTKTLVAGVRTRKEKFPDLYASIFQSIENVTKCFKESLLNLSTFTDKNIDESTSIYNDIEHLIDVNQSLLDCIGVGHSDISKVINTCKTHSLHSKLTGAGGGGCVIVLIPPNICKDQLTVVVDELKSLGYDCFQTYLGGDGVKLVEAS